MAEEINENIIETQLKDALGERYLAYAMSTIMSRSLPDVRDGLKPVHRRLLYAMHGLHLEPQKGFKKCARVVGDVIGKYHPHGDVAVYDAMVRLAQTFAVRYPLVEGQGNFGNIDGDNAAAMRYTEAKLTNAAMLLLDGLDKNATDFKPTYDGEDNEPAILPARYPNLLANGSSGIAVGMATNIPPHNIIELIDALLYLIKYPDTDTNKLVDKFIKGPDFPTGGLIACSSDELKSVYQNGKGAIRLRCRWHTENLGHGTYQIIVTEIPFLVQKSKLIEKVADLINNKKIQGITDIRDESDENIRIVLEPRSKNIEAKIIMEQLYKNTDFENKFNVNLNVLDDRHVPRVMPLHEILQQFLKHRKEVLCRISQFNLDKILRRLEVLEGLLVAYLNIDEVIAIIRENDRPKPIFIERFNLSDLQCEAILNMRLRQLRQLEEFEIKQEHKELSEEKDHLQALLADESLQWLAIADDLKLVKKEFNKDKPLSARRSEIIGIVEDIASEEMDSLVEREPLTIVYSKQAWIRSLKGHNHNIDELKYKEGDSSFIAQECYSTDKLIAMATDGKFYTLSPEKIPGGRGFGQPIRLLLDLPEEEDIIKIFVFDKDKKCIVAASDGRGFIVEAQNIIASTKSGKQVMNVSGKVKAQVCNYIDENDDMLAIVGENRRLLVFSLSEVPLMSRGRGVILQKYRMGGLGDVKTFNEENGLTWQLGDRTRTETDLTMWLGQRAQAGRMPPNGFPKTNKFE